MKGPKRTGFSQDVEKVIDMLRRAQHERKNFNSSKPSEEDAAKKGERQVAKSAAAMLLESRIGQRFDAIVTGASEKGTWGRSFASAH